MSWASAVRGLITLAVAALPWANALEVLNEPVVSGTVGDYVTLAFNLTGQGDYNYEVSVQEPWMPLSGAGRVSVQGAGFVSVTLRVPRAAPANERALITLAFENTTDKSDKATGRGYVEVIGSAGVALATPASLQGVIEEPLRFSVLVTNRGNMPDVFTLAGNAGMWDVRFEQDEVRLDPGEEREVGVALELRGMVNSGFRTLIMISANSRNDPSVKVQAGTRAIFYASGVEANTRQLAAPRINLSVGTGVTAALTLDEDGATTSVDYSINPRLSGDLSDYVRANAGIGRFAGSVTDPFQEVPSRLDVGLSADAWDASASIGNGSYALAGGGVVNDWRVGGSGRFRGHEAGASFGINAYAFSQVPGLDLQFSGATRTSPSGRGDSLVANYRTPLGDNLVLSVGPALSGFDTESGYVVTAGINESLSYQAQAFDVTQSYSGLPLAGVHSVGLTGGLRSAGPFGVRASTSLQLAPGSHAWRSSVVLSSRPAPGIGLGVTGTYQTSTTSSTYSVRPALSFNYRLDRLRGGFSVRYAYTGVLWGDVATSSLYGVDANGGIGPVSVKAGATYVARGATAAADASSMLKLQAAGEYKPGRSTTIAAEYEYISDTKDESSTTKVGVEWLQSWTETFGTELSYGLDLATRYATGVTAQKERVALIGGVRDLGFDGLNLSGGYAVSSSAGLFTGMAPLRHDLSVRAGYTFRFSFDTPAAIVDTFGGRKGGEVRGVAFLDRDLDGVRGSGEEVLAGLVVSLGGVTTTTGEDGSFRLRVPSGRYAWTFGSGLPASTILDLNDDITVEENAVKLVDLPFVPVASLRVTLFDDEDGDGVQSEGETGISFGGVIIDGPVRKEVALDVRGTTTVSGLVPGTYTVRPDPDRLPRRYRSTTDPVVVVIREGDQPRPVAVGAGAPPREVVTTFTASELAVIARVGKSSVVAGDDVEVTALVSGGAERVFVLLNSVEFPLERHGARWFGPVTIPPTVAAGRLALEVVAEGPSGSATAHVEVTVR